MKNFFLLVALLPSFAVLSQHHTSNNGSELKLTDAEVDQMQQVIKAKTKTARYFNNAFIGWVDTNYVLNGGSSTFNIYQNPIFMDSTVKAEFSNTTTYINSHAIGTTYDPTSVIWGQYQFSSVDSYCVDSVYIFGAYRTPKSIPNPNGDSLIVEFVWGPKSDTATYKDGAITYSGASPDNRCEFLSPKFSRALSQNFRLSGLNKIRKAIALTTADTVGFGSRLYGTNINQLIPAGNLAAFNFYFKSGYRSALSVGDTVFSTVSPNTVASPNFSTRIAQDPNFAQTNSIMYFCDPDGENGTSTLRSEELYGSGSNWLFPESYSGNFTYMMVSTGICKIGLDETSINNNVELYPNPTSGIVNIAITQGDNYTIELVNMLGQTVHVEEVRVSGNETLSRNFSELSNAIYLVNVKGDNYSSTSKLTISE